jgi:hypothetical protein
MVLASSRTNIIRRVEFQPVNDKDIVIEYFLTQLNMSERAATKVFFKQCIIAHDSSGQCH